MALESTQSLTEMSTRSISWGKGGRCIRLTTLPPSCAVVMKSGNLNFLKPSGPLQASNGTALPLHRRWVCYVNWELNTNVEIFEYFTRTVLIFIIYLRIEWKELFNHLCIPRIDVHKTLYYAPNDTSQKLGTRNYSNKCLCLSLTLLQIKKKHIYKAYIIHGNIQCIRYGEANFSQKHNYKYMAKWWCLLAMEKNYLFRPIAAIFRFWQLSC